MSQREPQPPQADAVEAAERPGEHVDRELGRERFAPEHERGRREQRGRRRCVAQRGARGVARGGHVGERQSPLERRHVGARAHDDGHRRPRHAVEQVPLAQEPGDRLALRRVRWSLDAQQRRDRVGIGPGTADRVAVGGRQRRRPVRAAERGADVRRDRSDHVADGRAPSMHGVEQHATHRGAVEHRGERAEQLGPAAAEPVARDIGIAERDDRDAAGGERPEQGRRGLGGLLRVVDDEEPQPREGAEGRGCRGVARAAAHDRGGEGGELGGVELRRPQLLLDLGVLGQEARRGDPLGARRTLAETRERGGVDAVLDRTHQEVAQLGPEAAQRAHLGRERIGPGRAEAVVDAALEQLADDLVVLGAREQRDRARPVNARTSWKASELAVRATGPRVVTPEPHGELVAQRGGRGSSWRTARAPRRWRSRAVRPGRRRARRRAGSCRCPGPRRPPRARRRRGSRRGAGGSRCRACLNGNAFRRQ